MASLISSPGGGEYGGSLRLQIGFDSSPDNFGFHGTSVGVISPSNRLTMLWYFWMYQRFSLLYLGIATGRTSVPSAFQTHGQVTGVPASCTGGRLSWSSLTLVRVRTRYSFATFRGPPLYAATGKMPSTSVLARYARRMSD